MKSPQSLIVTLFLILAAGCGTTGSSKPASSKAIVYYVPFQLEPNELITPTNVREKSNSVEITEKRSIGHLNKLFAKSKEGSSFNASRVRFQVVLRNPDRSIFVDNEGNLLEGTQQRRLDAKGFDAFQEIISANVTTGGEK